MGRGPQGAGPARQQVPSAGGAGPRPRATEIVEVNDLRRRSPKERTVTLTIVPGEDYEAGTPADATIEIIDDWTSLGSSHRTRR